MTGIADLTGPNMHFFMEYMDMLHPNDSRRAFSLVERFLTSYREKPFVVALVETKENESWVN